MLKYVVSIIFIALILFAPVWQTQAQDQGISAQVALGIPTGDMGDGYGMGFGLVGTYVHKLGDQLYGTGSLGYKYFGMSDLDGSFSTIPLLVGVRYLFSDEGVKPYAGAEIGLHFWSASVEIDLYTFGNYDVSSSGTDFGFTPYAGVYIPAGNLIIDLSLRYDIEMGEGDLTWLGISGGVLFPI